jgi:hypothetical protein
MRLLSIVLAMFLGCGAFPAQAREILGCERTSLNSVPFSFGNLGGVPLAQVTEGEWGVVFDWDSRFGYLSDQTIQWIVFRACYFAGNNISSQKSQELYEAETADCWAARELSSNLSYTDRDFQTIEYDVDVINKEASEPDFLALLGPRRSPYLMKCL